ncbi:hypothetical protein ABN034_30065 [Actinopolymorpha sp. B11F2]|uniref:hypothetical protein n=1 Tax=Actinopolymorpha sp. B11F2 TaxID=3160862 RepID=UPI0032E4D740
MDSDGAEHRIIEKVPVLTRHDFTSASTYPTELWIKADTGSVEGDRVEVTFAHGVQTTDGLTAVSLSANSVKWL